MDEKDIQAVMVKTTCDHCEGSGNSPTWPTRSCGVCDGDGYVIKPLELKTLLKIIEKRLKNTLFDRYGE